jgi:predicted nucleic acid-binding protein
VKLLITDSSPVISLAVIGRLDLLEDLYPHFCLPIQVFDELQFHLPRHISNAKDLLEMLRPRVLVLQNKSQLEGTAPHLGLGERASFALVRETGITNLLMDDKHARKYTELQGWHCFGTMALLLTAKKEGLVFALRPYFETFAASGRFYTFQLLNHVLSLAGEQPL